MNKLKTNLCSLAFLVVVATPVVAEVELKDAKPVLGRWLLESVAPGLEKKPIAENRTWEFKSDGTIFISGYNRHFHRNDELTVRYRIENGRIVSEQPGRPGKPLKYSVYELDDGRMILQGGLEGFYFFKRK